MDWGLQHVAIQCREFLLTVSQFPISKKEDTLPAFVNILEIPIVAGDSFIWRNPLIANTLCLPIGRGKRIYVLLSSKYKLIMLFPNS